MVGLSQHVAAAVGRALWTALFCLAVAASLITFPGLQLWMIAAWLAATTWCVARNRPGWLPLVSVVAVVLVKRAYLFPALMTLLVAMSAVAAVHVWNARKEQHDGRKRLRWGAVAVLWLAWLAMWWQAHSMSHRSERLPLDSVRPIACLGDSLTSGIPPDGGYPSELQKLLSVPVLDLGAEGITIGQGQRLLAESAPKQPQAVVIELGGHDFLKGADRDTTEARLRELIAQVRALGAEPILVEIPRGFMTDPYAGLERELAHREDLELVADTPIRKLVIWSPYAPPGMWMRTGHLSSDGLHPNAAGNRELAHAVARALTHVFGSSVRRANPQVH